MGRSVTGPVTYTEIRHVLVVYTHVLVVYTRVTTKCSSPDECSNLGVGSLEMKVPGCFHSSPPLHSQLLPSRESSLSFCSLVPPGQQAGGVGWQSKACHGSLSAPDYKAQRLQGVTVSKSGTLWPVGEGPR